MPDSDTSRMGRKPEQHAHGAAMTSFELLRNAQFKIGGEDQLSALREKYSEEPMEPEDKRRIDTEWQRLVADMHIRTGTLLKSDTVSFLLGAGASKECGGPLIGAVPLELERNLLRDGVFGKTKLGIRAWLKCFYLTACRLAPQDNAIPANRDEILQRRSALITEPDNAKPLAVNFEVLLGLLHKWRACLPSVEGRLRLAGDPPVDLQANVIRECIRRATLALAILCKLPTQEATQESFDAYRDLLRKILTRPLNLKRANVFTLNYDTLVEQAADAEGVVLIDGFVGTVFRTFRPESYDHDLYFPGETTEGRVHRLDRVLHLYKLHGSITWTADAPTWENPYGIRAHSDELSDDQPVLIYPTPAKSADTLGMPYTDLLRRFSAAVVRPQSVLFVLGYGFGDEHICAIVRQALAIPSFTLVIVDPNPQSNFVAQLRKEGDRRVWTLTGNTFGTFGGFVTRAMADLSDESIRRKVMDTHRALGKAKEPDHKEGGGDV